VLANAVRTVIVTTTGGLRRMRLNYNGTTVWPALTNKLVGGA